MKNTPSMELLITLITLNSRISKSINGRLSVHGISFTEFMLMHQLNQAPDKTMRRIDLAESIGLTASGVTRLLAPMEKIRLVQKQRNPRDARASLVKLSKPGEKILADSMTTYKHGSEELLGSLTEKQTETLLTLIRAMS